MMVQEATGSGTAEKSEPRRCGRLPHHRDDRARGAMRRIQTGRPLLVMVRSCRLIPLPIVDIVAVGGVQRDAAPSVRHLLAFRLSKIEAKSLIASLAGSVLPASTATTTAMGVTSTLKSIRESGPLSLRSRCRCSRPAPPTSSARFSSSTSLRAEHCSTSTRRTIANSSRPRRRNGTRDLQRQACLFSSTIRQSRMRPARVRRH